MAEVPAAIIEDILNNSRARGEPGSRGASTEKQFLVIRNAAYYEAKFGSGAFPYLIAVRRVCTITPVLDKYRSTAAVTRVSFVG